MNKRSIGIIVLVLFFGTLLGTLLGELLGWILPDSVVREFFLRSIDFSLAGLTPNGSGVISLDLIMFSVQFGLSITFNFTSIIGFSVAYYFLRYFR
ncbi:MAG: hypothetical protein CMF90_05575 [Candidatus Marinimicrobia bacterium]|jgi:hypothetical protein|nr:hypothetical protein [Candidatus Neomarinimicrobiota bacterium]MEC7622064.1 DUF4321 domain-containing protein [Candidatus Neomarinimicrobiota bacterium]MED5247943.1 DUF4321 domain-containing protein [Candidatus Neomarinimicrobiota bacterium]|tara:strand:- start:152 stop:439 length:288 start_codon:yes stop_codon:yes gene_type:complete